MLSAIHCSKACLPTFLDWYISWNTPDKDGDYAIARTETILHESEVSADKQQLARNS